MKDYGRLGELVSFHYLFLADFEDLFGLVKCVQDFVALSKSIIRIKPCEGSQSFHGLKISSLFIFHASQGYQLGHQINILVFLIEHLLLVDLLLYQSDNLDQRLLIVLDIGIVCFFEILQIAELLAFAVESGSGSY